MQNAEINFNNLIQNEVNRLALNITKNIWIVQILCKSRGWAEIMFEP